jgi:mono/diheme cytochrome c family protein
MKKTNLALAGIIYAIFLISSCNADKNETLFTPLISNDSLVKKGAYLVGIMGCHDCHTPKIMTEHGPGLDMDRLLSGHPAQMPLMPFDSTTTKNWVLFNMTGTAAVGPWGASFAANLTSDDTGIGTWSEAQFKKALTEGKWKGLEGSRPLLPPMPWENYKHIKEEDVRAIFAYLKSTKPVENIVPRPVTPSDLAQYQR